MCGICFAVDRKENIDSLKDKLFQGRLCNRGPDAQSSHVVPLTAENSALFCGFTLHFRGNLTPQPLIDSSGNVLLWNGEIFDGIEVPSQENDGEILINLLGKSTAVTDILAVLGRIQGPWAFVYFQKAQNKIWFGRDYFGRRSLLISEEDDTVYLSSVAVLDKTWIEVPSNGIYCLHISPKSNNDVGTLILPGANERNPEPVESRLTNDERLTLYPWLRKCRKESRGVSNIAGHDVKSIMNPEIGSLTERYGTVGVHSGILALNNTTEGKCGNWNETVQRTTQEHNSANPSAEHVKAGPESLLEYADEEQKKTAQDLISALGESVRIRVKAQSDYCSMCLQERLSSTRNIKHHEITEGAATNTHVPKPLPSGQIGCRHARTAVLFSGGIDSLVLAALADRYIDPEEPIDLLNVAFEQQRPHQSKFQKGNKQEAEMNDTLVEDLYHVPDRMTGLQGLSVLNPKRKWNFLHINITKDELQHIRSERVQQLVYPLQTVLDDSIGCAVWFAARGKGQLMTEDGSMAAYNSTARVLLVGMGADEQLVGYSRHRVKFNLVKCLSSERTFKVFHSSGRICIEYFSTGGWPALLDEIQMEINRISARNLGRDDRIIADHGKEGRFPYLDENFVSFLNSLPLNIKADLRLPRGIGEKLLLRLAALELGLGDCAVFPKRAIQFGSRIAKLENRKEKANDICDRLRKS